VPIKKSSAGNQPKQAGRQPAPRQPAPRQPAPRSPARAQGTAAPIKQEKALPKGEMVAIKGVCACCGHDVKTNQTRFFDGQVCERA
jgi:hypothetical protein